MLLGVRRSGEGVRIRVYDTGRGIEAGDLGRIFDEFQRASSSDAEGLGLGLAIVRRITQLLDVEVETRSEPGRGSCFALHLGPVQWETVPERPRPQRSARRVTEAKVLVVDNDQAALSATSALLERWGLETICAASFDQAARLCPQSPDLVIMDYRLDASERGDGVYESLSSVWGARPPAILLTAEDGEETEAAAADMGANRLLKPSSPAALRALIADCLSRRGASAGPQPETESATG